MNKTGIEIAQVPALTCILFVASLGMHSCTVVKPFKEVVVLVRHAESGEAYEGAGLELRNTANGSSASELTKRGRNIPVSNELGVGGFRLKRAAGVRSKDLPQTPAQYELIVNSLEGESRTFPLSGLNRLIEVDFGALKREDSLPPVADMHYHITMKGHNHFGNWVHKDHEASEEPDPSIPADITWYLDDRKLLTWVVRKKFHLFNRRYVLRKPGSTSLAKLGKNWDKGVNKKRRLKYEGLFAGKVRPAKKNNGVKHFTQATNPHVRDGGVKLAFNAISPFEANLSAGWFNRLANSGLKTGISVKWLTRIGRGKKRDKSPKDRRLTHWENFLLEYELMKAQNEKRSELHWSYYTEKGSLGDGTSDMVILPVIEGGHAVQHELFPNHLTYNIDNRTLCATRHLIQTWLIMEQKGLLSPGSSTAIAVIDTFYLNKLDIRADRKLKLYKSKKCHPDKYGLTLDEEKDLQELVDKILMEEVRGTIHKLKGLDPPVLMMTVAHLSYNGFMGHAPALDDAGFMGKITARRVYRIKVSEDPAYRRQWNSIFFTVSGLNKFGRSMITELLDTTAAGHAVQIDLKHCDVVVRQEFYEKIAKPCEIPPICSHCAVTGASIADWSAYNDEYALLKNSLTKNFYPFGINLYDEEVQDIYRLGGMIGITLEHRVLGGYINNKTKYCRESMRGGKHKLKTRNIDRQSYIEEVLQEWMSDSTTDTQLLLHLDAALRNIQARYGQARVKLQRALLIKEYQSVEPLMQNMFHVVDQMLKLPQESRSLCTSADPWDHICIGSDLDGFIDPIDAAPTASQYPYLREKLEDFIPIFLALRKQEGLERVPIRKGYAQNTMDDYFSSTKSLDDALDRFFYDSLKEFTNKYMGK